MPHIFGSAFGFLTAPSLARLQYFHAVYLLFTEENWLSGGCFAPDNTARIFQKIFCQAREPFQPTFGTRLSLIEEKLISYGTEECRVPWIYVQ